ncbi:DUF2314 domain-containing protein [Cerasicoccus fimbriatus]|uniref:DUF2314 domain-containing protein n=1 Tax=Cerasicoccus fimbriatus TaxID=3014554 RepID=UPI0022B3532E|nr:DUF2314 domain-containing protein [Cerasicoccus sp. TK19100]
MSTPKPKPSSQRIHFAYTLIPMVLEGSRRAFLGMAQPQEATANFHKLWNTMLEKVADKLDGPAIPPDGMEAHVFKDNGRCIVLIEFPPGAQDSDPLYAAAIIGPCEDNQWNSDAAERAPHRYIVGIKGGDKLYMTELIEGELKDHNVELEPDLYIFQEWVRNTAVHQSNIRSIHNEDPSMEAAIAQARTELPAVTERFVRGELQNFTVKVKVTDGDQAEHMWLSNPTYRDGVFTGTFESEPINVTNITVGQTYSAPVEQITDWMYLENEQMVGNYTLRAMLPRMSFEQANQYRKVLSGMEPLPEEPADNSAGMSPEGREELRLKVREFILSPRFNNYAARVYPSSIKGSKRSFSDAFLEVATEGKVEMACIVMANSALTSGRVKKAPALIIAGAGGDERSEQVAFDIMSRMAKEDYEGIPPEDVQRLNDMLADEEFQLFRMRELPRSFTGGQPVYFFDVMLSSECLMPGGDQIMPICPCIVAPNTEAKIFPIPMESVHRTESAPGTPPPLPTAKDKTPLSAIFALIFGILTWLFFLFAIPALLCGHQARSKIKKGEFTKGSGMALAGLILAYVKLALMITFLTITIIRGPS